MRRARIALAVALGALALAPAAAASRIVFVCGKGDICAIAPDGKGRTRLTRDASVRHGRYTAVQLSRDGSTMTFKRNELELYIADGRARQRRRVKVPEKWVSGMALTPDRRLGLSVASPLHPTYSRICRTPLRPGVLRMRCAKPKSIRTGYLGWGPDHRVVGVVDASTTRRELCVVTPRGLCRDRLVKLRHGSFYGMPALSPDERTLAVMVDFLDDDRIALFDARTGGHRRYITRGHRDYAPSWSPDGQAIAFIRDGLAIGQETEASICWTPVRGGRVRCPVKRERNIGLPSWGG